MKSQRLQLIIGLVIAAVALYFTFRGVSFREIFETVKTLRYGYLPLAFIVFALSFVFRAYRWRQLCMAVKPIPTRRLYSPMMIGFMGNLLPLRAGEFIRAFLLGKREEMGFSASFATIVVERLFDMMALLALFAGLLIFNPTVFVPQSGVSDPKIVAAVRYFGIFSVAIFVGLVAFCYFLVHQQKRTLRLVNFFTRILPKSIQHKIEEILRSFTLGLGILRDPKGIFYTILLSAAVWGTIVYANYPLYYCYQIQSLLPMSSLVTLVVLVAASTMIPTPGFVGPFQFAVTFALADLYGIDKSVAVSFSLVIWFLQMFMVFLAGFFFLVRDNISFFDVSRTAKEAADEVAEHPPS